MQRIVRTHLFLWGVLTMTMTGCEAAGDKPVVRPPAVAGQFYTRDSAELRRMVEQYVAGGERLEKSPPIIISPHAGYMFSGPVAGIGFAALDRSVRRVVLLGPSHRLRFAGLSVPDVDSYETPLGRVPLDREAVGRLRASPLVDAHAQAHALEHCLEVQLPFLQVLLDEPTIVPIITGAVEPAAAAELIRPLIDDTTALVVSSDFSHYLPHDEAKKVDERSVRVVLAGEVTGTIEACGETPIRVAMHLARSMDLTPRLLDARTSHETAPAYGGVDRVVGYASIVYLPDGKVPAAGDEPAATRARDETAKLSTQDKQWLLKLARSSLERAVRGEPLLEPDNVPEAAEEVCGCFVTLTKHGELRGCIGYIEGIKPLYQAVVDNARNAALSDPRFSRVSPEELDDITVEVSVLTTPRPLSYEDPEDLLNKLVPGRDGIILRKDLCQSTFLPQVWQQLPDKTQFLERLAMKAGLSRGAWRAADYRRYFAIHFQEER